MLTNKELMINDVIHLRQLEAIGHATAALTDKRRSGIDFIIFILMRLEN